MSTSASLASGPTRFSSYGVFTVATGIWKAAECTTPSSGGPRSEELAAQSVGRQVWLDRFSEDIPVAEAGPVDLFRKNLCPVSYYSVDTRAVPLVFVISVKS